MPSQSVLTYIEYTNVSVCNTTIYFIYYFKVCEINCCVIDQHICVFYTFLLNTKRKKCGGTFKLFNSIYWHTCQEVWKGFRKSKPVNFTLFLRNVSWDSQGCTLLTYKTSFNMQLLRHVVKPMTRAAMIEIYLYMYLHYTLQYCTSDHSFWHHFSMFQKVWSDTAEFITSTETQYVVQCRKPEIYMYTEIVEFHTPTNALLYIIKY